MKVVGLSHSYTKQGPFNASLCEIKTKQRSFYVVYLPVKPIDWTGVCRLDQFDGLQRGWFRGHYARIGSMGRKHK